MKRVLHRAWAGVLYMLVALRCHVHSWNCKIPISRLHTAALNMHSKSSISSFKFSFQSISRKGRFFSRCSSVFSVTDNFVDISNKSHENEDLHKPQTTDRHEKDSSSLSSRSFSNGQLEFQDNSLSESDSAFQDTIIFSESLDDEVEEIVVIAEEEKLPQASIDLFTDTYQPPPEEDLRRERQLAEDAVQSRLFRDHHAGLWSGMYEVFVPIFGRSSSDASVAATSSSMAPTMKLTLHKWQSGSVQSSIVAGLAEDYRVEDNAQDIAATESYTATVTNSDMSPTGSSDDCPCTSNGTINSSSNDDLSTTVITSLFCEYRPLSLSTGSPSTLSSSIFTCVPTTDENMSQPSAAAEQDLLLSTGYTSADLLSTLCRATQPAFHPSSLRTQRGNTCVENALTVSRCVAGAPVTTVSVPFPAVADDTKGISEEVDQSTPGVEIVGTADNSGDAPLSNQEAGTQGVDAADLEKTTGEDASKAEERKAISRDRSLRNFIQDEYLEEAPHVDEGGEEADADPIPSISTEGMISHLFAPSPSTSSSSLASSSPGGTNSLLFDHPSGNQISTELALVAPKVYVAELAVREDTKRTRVRFLYAPKTTTPAPDTTDTDTPTTPPHADTEAQFDLHLIAFVVLREVLMPALGSDGKIPAIAVRDLLPVPDLEIGRPIHHHLSLLPPSSPGQKEYVEVALPGRLTLRFPTGVREGKHASLTLQWVGAYTAGSSPACTKDVRPPQQSPRQSPPQQPPQQSQPQPFRTVYQLDRQFSTLQEAAIDALHVSNSRLYE